MPGNAIYSGGCACGAIRYEISSKPQFALICHCRDCQRATGNRSAPNAWFKFDDIQFVTKQPKAYKVVGLTGEPVYHEFCESCGSPIGMRAEAYSDFRGIRIASLDDPGLIEPSADVWTNSAISWDPLHPSLPKFEGQVPDADLMAIIQASQ